MNTLPWVGLGYRHRLHEAIWEHQQTIGCLEIMVDAFMQPHTQKLLSDLAKSFHVVLHGLNLSIGSTGMNQTYLDHIKQALAITQAPYYSDHLALTEIPGLMFDQLTPLALTQEQLHTVITKVHKIQDELGVPVVLENVTELIQLPGEIPLYEFLDELTDQTQCGLLLDLYNLYVNSFNQQFDGFKAIERWPLEAVYQIHLAGGRVVDQEMMDGHDASTPDVVWQLLRQYVHQMPQLKAIILERDENFPQFSCLMQELTKAQTLLKEVHRC